VQNSGAASASAGRQNQIYHNAGFLWCFVGNVVCVVSRNSGAGKLNMNYTDHKVSDHFPDVRKMALMNYANNHI